MKRVLVVGAGFLQTFIILKAKELGYYTITIDKNPNSIGFIYSDESAVIDIVDQHACLEYARSKKIDGVITAATDYGVTTTSYIAKEMKLPGLDFNSAQLIKDKYKVRKKLFENKVDDVGQFYEVKSIESLVQLKEKIRYPVMVKPTDGSGSKATRKVESQDEIIAACKEAIEHSLKKKALIEDFIEGREYGVESFVYNGEVKFVEIIGKNMTTPPFYAELGHFYPSQLEDEVRIKEIISRAINVLNINFGAVNMDILITPNNDVCIIDIGARMGGNLIGSHIIPIGTGINYIEALLQAAVGELREVKKTESKCKIATHLLALTPGKVKKLPDMNDMKEKYNVEIYHNLEINKNIPLYRNNLDGQGYIVSTAEALHKAISDVENVREEIDSNIIRY